MMRYLETLGALVLLVVYCVVFTEGRTRHCYTCRSRGPLGDCKDTFGFNETTAEHVRGVKVTPCASAWCAKVLEGKEDDYDFATERMCLQRPPEDLQERCADTLYKRRKVFMCFCRGDLCNSAIAHQIPFSLMLATQLLLIVKILFY